MPSEMVNILTHVISKDEDNVWLQVRVEGKGAADEGEEEELDYERAAGEGAGGEGGEEEEGLGGGHLPQLLVTEHSLSDQCIIAEYLATYNSSLPLLVHTSLKTDWVDATQISKT